MLSLLVLCVQKLTMPLHHEEERGLVTKECIISNLHVIIDEQDRINATFVNKELVKKMSPTNNKAFNTMRQRLRKHNPAYAEQMEKFREAPESEEEESEEEEEEESSSDESDEVSWPAHLQICAEG